MQDGTAKAYKSSEPWKMFKTIVSFSGETVEDDSGDNDNVDDGRGNILAKIPQIRDYIFGDTEGVHVSELDMNQDGKVDVADLVHIVNASKPEGNEEEGDDGYDWMFRPTCPDDHHPHMMDLGLPSGTKWSCCNVGASKPVDAGGYYAWGEIVEKGMYNWTTYQYHLTTEPYSYINIGSDISGTSYDVAHQARSQWQMPTSADFNELARNSIQRGWFTVDGVDGMIFSFANKQSIFFPAHGWKGPDDVDGSQSTMFGLYWTSEISNDDSCANSFWVKESCSFNFVGDMWRLSGLNVRAVQK